MATGEIKSMLHKGGHCRGVLYKSDASPPARAVMIIIDILGLAIEQKELNPLSREQDTLIFRKKNPMKTIPIYDGDFSLGDSHAIMLYLIDNYAKPEHSYLYPSDKKKRATITQRLFFDCGVLFPRLRSVMAPTYAGKLTELSKSMIRNIDDAYEMMEYYLSDTLYLADSVFTVADISAITTISSLNGLHPVDEQRFPKLKQWILNMNEKDFCKRINTPGSEQHVAGLKAFMKNARNINSKL